MPRVPSALNQPPSGASPGSAANLACSCLPLGCRTNKSEALQSALSGKSCRLGNGLPVWAWSNNQDPRTRATSPVSNISAMEFGTASLMRP
eukprot:249731-Amphidinium_carterae.1